VLEFHGTLHLGHLENILEVGSGSLVKTKDGEQRRERRGDGEEKSTSGERRFDKNRTEIELTIGLVITTDFIILGRDCIVS